MCRDCGCNTESAPPHDDHRSPEHGHHHPAHAHDHSPDPGRRTVPVREAILAKNDRLAARNRSTFRARGLCVLNVLSAPGSGKTELLRRTLVDLAPRLRVGVVVGDLATDNDARRMRETGA